MAGNDKTDPKMIGPDSVHPRPLPENPDEATLAEWLRDVLPQMSKTSEYRRNLARALARYDFRQRQAGAPAREDLLKKVR